MDRDVTERRALEERLAHLEKMESIGRLAGGIAHDFNNLLTAILGYTEMLLETWPTGKPDRAALEEIQKAGQRAASLTHQLLAFSRKQVLLPREVDLNQTVTGLQTMLRRLIREDIVLRCEQSPVPAMVLADPTQIEQAILNLVLNARDALPGGGWIRLDVARLAASDMTVPDLQDVAKADSYVRVRVSDNGSGIDPDAMPHLFEPFYTTKELGKGTGLGLASVHGIVHQSHGWIDVSSEPGEGSTFAFYLPAIALPEVIQPQRPAASQPAMGHETVLLVEDEDSVRAIVGAALRRHGYTVIESATPLGACDLFEQHQDEIDLLVTDVVMPVMNGPALAQRLVAQRPSLRVLFMSGYSGMATAEMLNPNISFLSKPFQTAVLATRVREMLNQGLGAGD
jgi:two-component system cell cycle sensor histidine kinase/response regulator CckA